MIASVATSASYLFPGAVAWACALPVKIRKPLAYAHRLRLDGRGLGGNQSMRRLAALALTLALVGCATITKGTTQTIAVDTPGVPGATCTIQTPSGPRGVVTPGTVALDKQSAALPITCTKECYVLGSSMIPSNTESM